MSKKKRPKKKYNARTLAIPAYLSTLDPDLGKPDSVARFKDQTFLMKIANQTASIEDVFVQQQVFQTAWILAERMDSTEAIRRALSEGMRALATYMVKDRKLPKHLLLQIFPKQKNGHHPQGGAHFLFDSFG